METIPSFGSEDQNVPMPPDQPYVLWTPVRGGSCGAQTLFKVSRTGPVTWASMGQF
jgi:hypothetical protein